MFEKQQESTAASAIGDEIRSVRSRGADHVDLVDHCTAF